MARKNSCFANGGASPLSQSPNLGRGGSAFGVTDHGMATVRHRLTKIVEGAIEFAFLIDERRLHATARQNERKNQRGKECPNHHAPFIAPLPPTLNLAET